MMKLNEKIDAFGIVFIVFKAFVLCGVAFIDPLLIIPAFILAELISQITETKKEEEIPDTHSIEVIVQEPQRGKKVKKAKNLVEKIKKTPNTNNQEKSSKPKVRRSNKN